MVNEDKYQQKQAKRLSQKKNLLVSKPSFQKDIRELREKWNIPFDGLKNADEIERWFHQLYEDSDRYSGETWLKYRLEFEKLRRDRKFLEREKLNKKLNDENPINAFRIDIKDMVKKHNLAPRWHDAIKGYLLSNTQDGMSMFLGISIRIERDEDNGLEELLLHIPEDTTLPEMIKFWPWVKLHQKRLSYRKQEKFQPIKNLDRDKRIFELAEQDMSYQDIAETVKKEFEISENFGYDSVSRILSRYRKRIGQQ